MHVFMLSIQITVLIPACKFVCLINVNNSTAVCWVLPWDFPATSINLLLVAIIVNLTKVTTSYAKTPSV